jgi:hypothetical protein
MVGEWIKESKQVAATRKLAVNLVAVIRWRDDPFTAKLRESHDNRDDKTQFSDKPPIYSALRLFSRSQPAPLMG